MYRLKTQSIYFYLLSYMYNKTIFYMQKVLFKKKNESKLSSHNFLIFSKSEIRRLYHKFKNSTSQSEYCTNSLVYE